MDNNEFKTSIHAKCILAGEHSVLQGCPAIVMPVSKLQIDLSYKKSNIPISNFKKKLLDKVFYETFLRGLQQLNKKASDIDGEFAVENHIPIAAGLGFSAALCVAIARWFDWKYPDEKIDVFQFAKQLEDNFHGTSSGLDIAGVIADGIIRFENHSKNLIIREVESCWHPNIYLSYSGVKKMTKSTVHEVQELKKKFPEVAKAIHEEMKDSVLGIEAALKLDKADGLYVLASALEKACQCFAKWGLITPPLKNHIDQLYALGALAVKPTGAGRGGYVVSLWQRPPPAHCEIELIAV